VDSPAILLVDDDKELLELLQDYLQREGFKVDCVYNGKDGIDAALSGDYDLVVLDIMMPQINGIHVLSMVRAQSNIPVLMLTAKGDDTDRIMGLELGADDYVPKPCTARELSARIRSILNRMGTTGRDTSGTRQAPLVVGNLSQWSKQRRVENNGVELSLTSTEFSLLEELMKHAGNPVSKDELSIAALGRPLSRYERSIDVHISSIRRKLEPLSGGRSLIRTIVRKGYQLVAD
jgi:two-component system OmpR family response regulator/two-component system response regulator CpxR